MKYTRERKGTQQTKHRQNIQRGTPLDIHMRIFLEQTFYPGLLRSWDRLSCHVQTLDTYVFTLQVCNTDVMILIRYKLTSML